MRDVDAISIAGIAYLIIVIAVTAIFFRPYLVWSALGGATALFNHSLMIRVNKNGFNTRKFMGMVFFRFVMYAIMCAFLYVNTIDQTLQVVIISYVFLFLGFSTIRAGVFLHLLPFIKHHTTSYKEEVEARQKRLEEEKQADVDTDR